MEITAVTLAYNALQLTNDSVQVRSPLILNFWSASDKLAPTENPIVTSPGLFSSLAMCCNLCNGPLFGLDCSGDIVVKSNISYHKSNGLSPSWFYKSCNLDKGREVYAGNSQGLLLYRISIQNLFQTQIFQNFRYPVMIKFCTEHSSITAMTWTSVDLNNQSLNKTHFN